MRKLENDRIDLIQKKIENKETHLHHYIGIYSFLFWFGYFILWLGIITGAKNYLSSKSGRRNLERVGIIFVLGMNLGGDYYVHYKALLLKININLYKKSRQGLNVGRRYINEGFVSSQLGRNDKTSSLFSTHILCLSAQGFLLLIEFHRFTNVSFILNQKGISGNGEKLF